jgi:hypothetical protein
MKAGDLVRHSASLGLLMRKLQYETDDDLGASNWDGNPAWWIKFVEDNEPLWAYEEELHLVKKGN